ncbi:MAG: Membrane-bound lytic murein transglycosylase D [Gammaproteobacteria bacterium]|nr:Membrane-bound lytic murein transglycosylase D [Gammaproteobacteria bacterium]
MPVSNRSISVVHAIVYTVLGLLLAAPVSDAKPPAVETHDLGCGDTFPCLREIQRRVDFWIKVFRSWNTDQLIFHDRANPARVYSVMTSKYSCRRSKAARPVRAERKRIEDMLRTLAKKATWEKPGWSEEELGYLRLFPKRDPDEISPAVNRVRCQQGNRDRFQKALKRYGRYRSNILKVLRGHDLSEDLIYLPFVESAYNPEAYSRAGAAGLWQIMPATARKLGLQLDATMDERFDPHRSTWAAARYLRRSTDRLNAVARQLDASVEPYQVNPFVITSYNYGVTGMARAIRAVGPDYIEVLNKYRSRSFRTAVRNFYASFLAARYVARNAEKYFGPIKADGELAVAQFVLTKPISVDRIVNVFGVHRKTVKRLNPALTRYVWKGWRLIPKGYTLKIPYRKGGWKARIAKLESLPTEHPQLSGRQYVVQRGDTACEIARVFKVHCKDLIQLNGLGRRALIRVDQKLDIPGRPKPTASQRVASIEGGSYTVRRGDTACEIADSFKVACNKLIRANGLGSRAIIHIGQKLRIPGLEQARQVAKIEAGKTGGDGSGKTSENRSRQNSAGQSTTSKTEPVSELMEAVDVGVQVSTNNGNVRYTMEVLPGETLGHYADWLGLGGTRRLRKLNNIPYGARLRSGRTIELPISGDSKRLSFEADRFEFHQTLVDEFSQYYKVTGVKDYTIKLGDTLWKIANRHDIPYWVLNRTNRSVDRPVIGQKIRVPIVEARNESKQPLLKTN